MNGKAIIKKSKNVVTRQIEGNVILMPLTKTSKELNYIYTLNETASRASSMFDGKRSLARIQARLLEEYVVDEKSVAKQLAELVKDLKSFKAIA